MCTMYTTRYVFTLLILSRYLALLTFYQQYYYTHPVSYRYRTFLIMSVSFVYPVLSHQVFFAPTYTLVRVILYIGMNLLASPATVQMMHAGVLF